jgi:hypothetical protein
VFDLAAIGLRDRLYVLRPLESGLKNRSRDLELPERDSSPLTMVEGLFLVRRGV